MASKNNLQTSAIAGIIAPVIFVTAFTIEGWLRPGYGPLAHYVSALSLGPRGWIQITNFIVFGSLFFVFSRGIATRFKNEKVSQTGPVLLTIIAIGILLSGPFVMDPTDTPPTQMSLHGTVHGILGGIVFLLMPISCFVFLNRFRKDSKYYPFRWWTLVMAIIITAADILFTLTTKLPAARIIFHDWFGLIQRSVLVPYMIWICCFAIGIYRLTKQEIQGLEKSG
jgi:hypothetical membrane protein